MSGISRLLAKELSAALGITDNPKFSPMFKRTDEVISDVADPDDPTVARFYSPLESAIENAPIGKEGTRGENVEAFVRKRAPKVSKAEMEFRGLGLEPGELYTAESAKEGLSGLNVKAVKQRKYQGTQRQKNMVDEEIDYVELSLEADEELNYPANFHYGSSNIAHTRYSVRSGSDDNYILIEELQSDALQNSKENVDKIKTDLVKDYKPKFDSAIDDIAFKSEFDNPGNFFDEFEDFVFNKFIPIRTNSKLSDKEAVDQLRTIFNDIGVDESEVPDRTLLSPRALKVYFETLAENKLNVYDFSGKDNILGLITDEVFDVIAESRKVVAKKDVPVSSITDTVRLALQAIISDAKSKGIDHIVLPPVERLAKERGVSTAKGSAFYNTYVAAYKKVMKQLEAELGKQVKVGKRDIVYKDLDHPDYDLGDPKYKTEQGTLLDISNLTVDPTTTKLRFNKGGLVERPER